MKAVILVEKAELRSEFDKTETALKTANSGGVFQLIQALVGEGIYGQSCGGYF